MMTLRRHADSGAPCDQYWCHRAHQWPRHRRSGPHNVQESAYVGRHDTRRCQHNGCCENPADSGLVVAPGPSPRGDLLDQQGRHG